jgi:hypothetical protein
METYEKYDSVGERSVCNFEVNDFETAQRMAQLVLREIENLEARGRGRSPPDWVHWLQACEPFGADRTVAQMIDVAFDRLRPRL